MQYRHGSAATPPRRTSMARDGDRSPFRGRRPGFAPCTAPTPGPPRRSRVTAGSAQHHHDRCIPPFANGTSTESSTRVTISTFSSPRKPGRFRCPFGKKAMMSVMPTSESGIPLSACGRGSRGRYRDTQRMQSGKLHPLLAHCAAKGSSVATSVPLAPPTRLDLSMEQGVNSFRELLRGMTRGDSTSITGSPGEACPPTHGPASPTGAIFT